jgi:AcrR family transcriptional regulator
VTKGYDGLTMRDLARVARVSVPTLYNLFGSKDAILLAELEAEAAHIAARLKLGETFFTRGMAAFEAGMQRIAEAPELYRAIMRMAIASPASGPMRQRAEEAFIAIMAGNLGAAKQVGQVVEWAEPRIVARHMFAQHSACFMAWALGEIDFPTFRAASLSGTLHFLIGITRGPFLAEVEERMRTVMRDASLQQFLEVRNASHPVDR